MTRDRVVFWAGLSRAAFGVIAMVALPLVYPAMAAHRLLFTGYIVLALGEQVLIRARVGGEVRSFCAACVDLCMITWLAHRAGSVATPLVALYFFSGIMNALAVSLRVGLANAVMCSVAYAGLVVVESLGWVPYGIDAPPWRPNTPPPLSEGVMAAVLVAILLIVSTAVVGLLRGALETREKDLGAANARLEELSQRDPLTGLYNRRRMLEQLGIELARVGRGRKLALLMMDLDGFKRVNDTQGHLRGDQLLAEIGAALQATARAADVASRYGGDEFVILLPDVDAEQATVAAERFVAAVQDIGVRFGKDRPVTASAGIAIAKPGDNDAALLRRADESAYKAKRGGGNKVELAA